MNKILFFIVVFFTNILFVCANNCPHFKLAKAYIPKTFSAFTNKSGYSGKEIYKVKPLTNNNYLITGKGGNSIVLKEECGLVSFELPFTLEEKDENEQDVIVSGNYMCEGNLRRNMNISGTCTIEIELSNHKIFKDTLTFKWRPKR